MNTKKKKNQKIKQGYFLHVKWGDLMRKEYNFSNARKNPYISKDIEQITITLDSNILNYFKNKATKTGIPYQVLITSYLKDCVKKNRKLEIN